jgi:hypothetical protein
VKKGWGSDAIARYNADSRASLLKSIRDSGTADLIISGEAISTMEAEDLSSLKAFFQPYYDAIVIAGYVRAPYSYMNSDFQQKVKGSLARLDLKLPYPHYRRKFEKFDSVFGRESVLLWKFEPEKFPNGCVVTDFCARFGIQIDSTKVARVNESLPRNALNVLFTYRKFGPGYGIGPRVVQENHQLVSALTELGGGKVRLSPSLVAPVLSTWRDDIAWIEERIGESLAEQLTDEKDDDIRSEEDLLRVDAETVARLKSMAGADEALEDGSAPESIAALVEALRTRLRNRGGGSNVQANRHQGTKLRADVTARDLVELVRQTEPDLLAAISDNRAAALIHKALLELAKRVESIADGVIKVRGLGQFHIVPGNPVAEDERLRKRRVRYIGRMER